MDETAAEYFGGEDYRLNGEIFVSALSHTVGPQNAPPFALHFDKRQVLKSLLETTRQRFNVSAAEVDQLDLWQRATIAVACVSKDQVFVDQVLNKVLRTIEGNPRVEVAHVDMEFL